MPSCFLLRARATTCSSTTSSEARSSSVSPFQQGISETMIDALRLPFFSRDRASRSSGETRSDVRLRWRMSADARGLIFVSSVLLAFGLAVLYSASAIVAMNEGKDSAYYLLRQVKGAVAGIVVFAIAAKFDAERLRDWAWPLMWFIIVAMAATLLLPESIAPKVHGSRRFLLGRSFQPSELGKLAVVLWVSMLLLKKGEQMRRLTKGIMPFLVVIGVLDVLAALEPDLSVAMLYTLLMAVLLFAGGVRIGHFVALGIIAMPLLWTKLE